ncbi:hypothetical protein Tco_0489724 [Tanacetum coccineum]
MSTYLKHMAGYKQIGKESSKKDEADMAQESSLKRDGDELEQEKQKKQKIDDNQEKVERKKLIEVVPDKEEVVIDAIPLTTKPPCIKLVKAKHGSTRPEEGYERVLWGDLRTMFELNIEDTVLRNLLGNKVLFWKLFDSCGVHFLRFQDMHLLMLVEKRYPLTPSTITDMLNKKLQTDQLNEMCYQLLKLMKKQLKKQ